MIVREIPQGNQGDFELKKRKRDYTRVFEVVTDNSLAGPYTVINAVDSTFPVIRIPLIGSSYTNGYEFDTGSLLIKISPNRPQPLDNLKLWHVSCSYTSDLGGMDPAQELQDPLSRPPVYSWSFSRFTRPVQEDLSTPARQLVNSAKMPFNPPLEVEDSRLLLNIVKNKASVDEGELQRLANSINNANWGRWDAKTLKALPPQVSQKTEDGFTYYEHTYQLEFNKDGWNPLQLLDQGFYEKEFGTGRLRVIRDAYGQPMQEQSLLNGLGQKLGADATPVFLDYNPYREVDFSDLIFPN